MGRHDSTPAQAAFLVVYAHEPVRLIVDDGAIDLRQGDRDGVQPFGRLRDVGFRHADVCDFRIGVRDPRNDEGARLPAAVEQRVLNDDARHGIGGVRELERGADVTGRVHPWVRRLETVVDLHALRGGGYAGRVESQAVDVRRAAGGDEYRITCGRSGGGRFSAAPRVANAEIPSGAVNAFELHAKLETNAVGFERAANDRGRVCVLARQDLRRQIQHHD